MSPGATGDAKGSGAISIKAILLTGLLAGGILYGAFVWACMTQIVLPLSRVRPVQHTLERDPFAIAIVMVCIGLPVAWQAGKYYRRTLAPAESI